MFPLRDNVASRSFAIANYGIVAANVAAFFHEIKLDQAGLLEHFIESRALIPLVFWQNPWAQWPAIFYSMFLHGGWMHIIGNMWFLLVFGNSVEDRIGHFRYLIFYLLSGVFAALSQAYLFPTSRVPMIGASGAIAGVLGGYFLLFPRARILALWPIWIFIRVIEIPAFFYLAFWFLLQAFQGVGPLAMAHRGVEAGGVAWWAHAGGFIAGAILIGFFPKRRRFAYRTS